MSRSATELAFVCAVGAVFWGAGLLACEKSDASSREIAFVKPRPTFIGEGPIEISLGDGHACALFANGTVACWGDNSVGQSIAHHEGDPRVPLLPTLVPDIRDALHVAAAGDHTCVVRRSGSITCWGSNAHGELGGRATSTTDGDKTTHVGSFSDLFSKSGVTCGMRPNQVPRCFGANHDGLLLRTGDPDRVADTSYFADLDAMTHIEPARQVTLGERHACALFGDGTVQCWGNDDFDQLGSSKRASSERPVAVSGLDQVLSIDAGRSFSCAVRRDRTVWCWGDNDKGQLGLPNADSKSASSGDAKEPERVVANKVPGLDDVIQIATGARFVCALKENGTVSCWGQNDSGQLGDETKTDRFAHLRVETLQGVSTIGVSNSINGSFACALLKTRKVRCWGHNAHGELGDGGRDSGLRSVEVVLP